jgi:hypothetical protein
MENRKELAKTYEPREVEDRIYAFWHTAQLSNAM